MGNALKILQSMQKDGVYLYLTEEGELGYESSRSLTEVELKTLRHHKSKLSHLLKATLAQNSGVEKIEPRASILQEDLFLLCQTPEINQSYNLAFTLDFIQKPEIEKLRRALQHIQDTQPSMTTGFLGQPDGVNICRPHNIQVPLEQITLSKMEYEQWLPSVTAKAFDLSSPPLWCFYYVEFETKSTLVVVVHHIVWDGWSSSLFRSLLDQEYAKHEKSESNPNSGTDYFALTQDENKTNGQWDSSRQYWYDLLENAPKQNAWLVHRELGQHQAGYAKQDIGLKAFTVVPESKRFNLVLASWFLALGRHYKCNKMVVGVAVANRSCCADLEECLGYFNNVVPVVQDQILTISGHELAQRVGQQWQKGLPHHDLPFSHIVNTTPHARSLEVNPLTQVVIGYQSFNWEKQYTHLPHHLSVVRNTVAKLPLSVQVSAANNKLRLEVEYDKAWYGENEIHKLIQEFTDSLEELVNEEDKQPVQAQIEGKSLVIPATLPHDLSSMLKQTAKNYPDKCITFIDDKGEKITTSFTSLFSQAKSAAGCLQQGQLWEYANRPVIIVADSLLTYLENFWAVVLAGGYPVTINVPQLEVVGSLSKLTDAYKQLNDTLVVCCPKGRNTIISLLDENGEMALTTPQELPNHSYLPFQHDPNAPGIIQLSSGSTGKSKCIQQSHRAILHYCELITQSRAQIASDISLNWMGFDHVGGLLFTHLRDTYLGCSQVHVATQWILKSPLRWLSLIAEYGVTHSWCPNFGYKLMISEAKQASQTYDLSSVKELINGGEMVVADTVREFIKEFSSWGLKLGVMTPAFGMAESCTVISTHPVYDIEAIALHSYAIDTTDGYTQIGHSEFVSLGKPIANTSVRIVNDANKVVTEYQVGKMQLSGPSITKGYLRAATLNQKAFTDDGWFDTGDCGVIADGELYLTGRIQESIVLNGVNFFSHDIESQVGQVNGVLETSVAAAGYQDNGDAAVIFYVLDGLPNKTEVENDIRQTLARTLQFYPNEVISLRTQQFLKTTSGKIQRRKMVMTWLDDKDKANNPVRLSRLTQNAIDVDELSTVSLISVEQFITATTQAEQVAIVLGDDHILSLITQVELLTQAIARCEVSHLILVTTPNLGAEISLWCQAFQHTLSSVSIRVITCSNPQALSVIPSVADQRASYFDGATWYQEQECSVDWSRIGTDSTLKTNGYSVITGASGGIAHHLIDHLNQQGEFLVLISRSRPAILNQLSPTHYLWLSADISDDAVLQDRWSQAKSIDDCMSTAPKRVYHLASSFHEDSVLNIDSVKLSSEKSVNEGGLNNLLQVLQPLINGVNIQWLVFGSINGVRGGEQSLSYSLSNAATRFFSQQIREKGVQITWLGWSAWRDVGLSVGRVNDELLQLSGLQYLQAEHCLQMLPFIVGAPAGDYLVGSLSTPSIRQIKSKSEPLQQDEFNPFIEPLKSIWQTLLNKDVIPLNQSFFELGGSSVQLYKLQHQIEEQLGCNSMTMADLFGAPTVDMMARLVWQKLPEPLSDGGTIRESMKTKKNTPHEGRMSSVKQRFKRRMAK
ncbi:MAG: AMP-binding protein [Aliivibrio sp.]|uniref:condensation domain-containing protein n=1 Tax=Aliivibrio sp. TaxID=1872443 RepID=UPI001A3A3019|nr:AMP-binding protein [Aliivibrio sp.]